MKRSSGVFAWIGDGEPPFEGLTPVHQCLAGEVSAALVPGDLPFADASRTVLELCGETVPWMAFCGEDREEEWTAAGAAACAVPGTPARSILSALAGLARLSESSADRNPLSGLPGNTSIAERLGSGVLRGGCEAAYFDISGFKPFNDYYGFSRGDAVLRSLASILRENLAGYFIGHIGGDDFVAVGGGGGFAESVVRAVKLFNGRAGGFYSAIDQAAGGIEALDRSGSFRFYPIMDLTVSIVNGEGCSTVDELARKAGLEKKRIKGEFLPDTVAGFLGRNDSPPAYGDFERWVESCRPDVLQIKALLEAAGILGDTGMTCCLASVLRNEKDYRIRKSAARALGNMAAADSAEALKDSLKDDNVHVRTAATVALPLILGRGAGEYLGEAVDDSNTWVRRAALRGLGVSGWEGAAGILRRELERHREGRYWLNYRQELAAALEGAAFLGDPSLACPVAAVLAGNTGVSREAAWKALMTLGGRTCVDEIMKALREGRHLEFASHLESLHPEGLDAECLAELESGLLTLSLRRRADRAAVLKFLGRLPGRASEGTSAKLLSMAVSAEDAREFEILMQTLQSREVPPRAADLSRIVGRISKGILKLPRGGIVSLLRWASTGSFFPSREFLEKLLRHDSREVRTAAARAVVSLARRSGGSAEGKS